MGTVLYQISLLYMAIVLVQTFHRLGKSKFESVWPLCPSNAWPWELLYTWPCDRGHAYGSSRPRFLKCTVVECLLFVTINMANISGCSLIPTYIHNIAHVIRWPYDPLEPIQLSMVNMANLGGIELPAVRFIVKLLGTSFIVHANSQLEYQPSSSQSNIRPSRNQLYTKLSDSCTWLICIR